MKIAIIPARSGSKRIPLKNIKTFKGKPIIFWTLKTIISAKLFDRIIVSTDNKKIAKIAKKFKAEIPFIRPKSISNDFASTPDVIKHAINWLKLKKISPKYVCCIYPTAAFMSVKDLLNGYKKIKTNRWNFIFSAGKFQSSIFRSFKKNSKGLKMIFPKYYKKRTQDIKDTYFDAGQFYWGKTDAWKKTKPIFSKDSSLIEIPRWRIHDIDTMEDWKTAEKMWIVRKL
mgnify:FL=1|tara:strand:- start:1251 stop:1934 length:684 start_codon:yes stop_codon:yes gene_type:complete